MTAGLMIAAPASGTGKTTVMLGLLRALHMRGIQVQPFKNGPDYIDPAFHRAACGRDSFNLDSWAMGRGMLDALAAQADGADLALAEGSMGLFDGVASRGESGHGSGGELARAMGWPVVLVVDAGGQAQSAAAVALGFAHFPGAPELAGVIVNKVASPRHERLVRAGFETAGIPVLGVLPREKALALPERHLGLVQAMEHPDLEAAIAQHGAFIAAHVDIDALLAAALSAPPPSPVAPLESRLRPPAQRIALAMDAAFSFVYPHLLQAWRAAGAEILPFSPLADEAPDLSSDLVWLPGGYPELHAGRIAGNARFLNGLRAHAEHAPVHGECGGYMVLGAALIDAKGESHAMAGLLGLVTSFERRRLHLGYRTAELRAPMPGLGTGRRLRGHEFHYATIIDQPDPALAVVQDAEGTRVAETGSVRGLVTGTFFHLIAEAGA
jgi:cobyrinic acid a,c-diamide synthase